MALIQHSEELRSRPLLSPLPRPTFPEWPGKVGSRQPEAWGGKHISFFLICCLPADSGSCPTALSPEACTLLPLPPQHSEPQGSGKGIAVAGPHQTFQEAACCPGHWMERNWRQASGGKIAAHAGGGKVSWQGNGEEGAFVIFPLSSTRALLPSPPSAPGHKDTQSRRSSS